MQPPSRCRECSCLWVSSGTAVLLSFLILCMSSDSAVQAASFRSRSDFLNRQHMLVRRDLAKEQESPSLYKALGGSSWSGLPENCRSCSIVGNAGTLKGSGLGWLADSSDCVVRLGLAPTGGHETDVGSKTTVRVITGDSFLDLFRRPERLVTGDLRAETWVLFNHSSVDPLKVRLQLGRLSTQANLTVLTVTQAGETDAKNTFKLEAQRIGYKQLDSLPSTLWHAVQVVTQAGCTNTRVLGVPGPMYCKKHANSYHGQTDSRYWGTSSPPLCSQGKDWGSGPLTSHDRVIGLADRRSLKGWATARGSEVTFMAPTWSLVES